MTVTELRREIKKKIDKLPPEEFRSVADYVDFISERADRLSPSDRAKIAGMTRRIAKADRDFAQGRFTTLDKLRRKY